MFALLMEVYVYHSLSSVQFSVCVCGYVCICVHVCLGVELFHMLVNMSH